jgi:putative membrane protein
MTIARRIILSLAVAHLSALASAQAVDPQSNGNKPLNPSSQVRQPATDGGLNETAPSNPTEPDSTSTPPARTGAKTGDLRAAADQSFVRVATQSGMTEIELGKLALAKSSRQDVKKFAAAMVRDYTRQNSDLSAIAAADGLSLPQALDTKQAALVQSMNAQSGKDFDSAYVKQMMDDHAQAVSLFKNESSVGADKLAAFAQKTLPALQQRQRMAGRLVTT